MSTPTQLTRSLDSARAAYDAGDASASARAHGKPQDVSVELQASLVAPEKHSAGGDFLKSIVLGGLDGIITTFAVVAGATGGSFGPDVILVLGLSSILADALSMGLGDALSTKAEQEYVRHEQDRERWELQHYPDGEIDEMVELYVSKGMSEADARDLMVRFAKYPELFVEFMVHFELGLQVPDKDDNPWKGGFVTFCSFVCFGFCPLLVYLAFHKSGVDTQILFVMSCVIAGIMFFLLGAVKTLFTQQKWYRGGAEIFCMGSLAAAVSYVIGWAVEQTLLH